MLYTADEKRLKGTLCNKVDLFLRTILITEFSF